MITDNDQKVFLELVRAGLWEKSNDNHNANHVFLKGVDWEVVYRLAEEQSVMGLVASGIDMLPPTERPPQEVLLQFIGSALQIEQQNKAMNEFVAQLIEKLRNENVYAILVKGQGVAQCYEKPLWRASGDVDLLLSEDNYNAAKSVLEPIADEVHAEEKRAMHQAIDLKGFDVELHGRMPFVMSRRVDKVIDEAQRDVFYGGCVRSWMNGNTTVFLPSPDNDVIFVFTHFLCHFFIEGVGLRQICDWCRMLWTYRESLNHGLLESRIRTAGLLTEWQAFASLAVDYLGIPVEAMPFYDKRFKTKGSRILKRIMKSGNFGHNNDLSYRTKYTGMKYNAVAMWRRFTDFASLVPVFPMDAQRFFMGYLFSKVG